MLIIVIVASSLWLRALRREKSKNNLCILFFVLCETRAMEQELRLQETKETLLGEEKRRKKRAGGEKWNRVVCANRSIAPPLCPTQPHKPISSFLPLSKLYNVGALSLRVPGKRARERERKKRSATSAKRSSSSSTSSTCCNFAFEQILVDTSRGVLQLEAACFVCNQLCFFPHSLDQYSTRKARRRQSLVLKLDCINYNCCSSSSTL